MLQRFILTCLPASFLAAAANAQLPTAPSHLVAARSTLSALSGIYQVNLTWQNSSAGATGYEVERKEWASGEWISLGNIGNYDTDNGNGLKASTQYFYRIRALNSTGASSFSNEADVTTAPVPAFRLQEAEQAQRSSPTAPIVAHSATGYTGTGYVDFIGASNEELLFRPEIPQAGTYRVEFRYANGAANNRPLEVKLNGVVIAAALAFPPTGSWNTWSTASVTASFAFDDTFLSLRSIGYSGANIDSVKIVPVFTGARINFQPAAAPLPSGSVADSGAVYGSRANGLIFGWNLDNSANTRDRNSSISPDQRYDTLVRTQNGGDYFWELAVPNGRYAVTLTMGDPGFTDSVYTAKIEGMVTASLAPSASARWTEEFRSVNVTDGRLTIRNAPGASNNKFAFVEVYPRPPLTTIFNDDFNEDAAGVWEHDERWYISSGQAHSIGGSIYTELKTVESFLNTDYVIETRAKGYLAQTGSSWNNFGITFGESVSEEGNYHVSVSAYGMSLSRSFPLGEETLDFNPLTVPSDAYVTWKIVRDGMTGAIQVYVNQGAGYSALPVLETIDFHYPYLGRFGWLRSEEAPEYDFQVDWFKVSGVGN